jgi:hypothetical protein
MLATMIPVRFIASLLLALLVRSVPEHGNWVVLRLLTSDTDHTSDHVACTNRLFAHRVAKALLGEKAPVKRRPTNVVDFMYFSLDASPSRDGTCADSSIATIGTLV